MDIFTVILIIFGFGGMLLQDVFLMKKKQGAGLFGYAGALLLASGLIFSARSGQAAGAMGLRILFMVLTVGFLLLEVYAVFIAVAGSGGKAVDRGLYGFCRHPGFWTLFLCLAFSMGGFGLPAEAFILANALNFILILIEDRKIFPSMIDGYTEYKERVGFLFPYRRSKRV